MTIALTAHPSLPASLVTARRVSRHRAWIISGRPGALATAYLINFVDVERGASGTDPFGTGTGASRTPLETAWHWAVADLADTMRQAACNTFTLLAPYSWLTQDDLI